MTSAAVEIPSTIDDVDSQWLTSVLRADASVSDTAIITDVRPERIAVDSSFSSVLYRLHATGAAGVPSSYIVKLPATESRARATMKAMGGYSREVTFYRQVAGRAPIKTPHAYAARMAPNGTDFILVLEDLQNWTNVDQLTGLSLDQARSCIDMLAALHGWSADLANSRVLQAFPSMDSEVTRKEFPAAFAQGWAVYRNHTNAPVPPAIASYAERFAQHTTAALEALTERSMLLHGDIRAENMFFDGDRLKVVDFQLAARGVGAADIGYLVSQSLPTVVRSGRDAELLGEYLTLLASRGITDYSFEDAWRHYRFAVAYLVCLPVIILIGWDALSPRSRRLCLTLVDRAVATIDEIDALKVFE